jgi:UDP-GlcNAc:undecaprenyl-phosphate GlcNAc-1-phosphate transferase
VLDGAWLVWWRWRHGQPVGRGDRNHLHHRLIDKGYGQRQIVLGYAAFCAVFGVIGLMASTTVSKLLALAALVLLGGFVLRWAAPE